MSLFASLLPSSCRLTQRAYFNPSVPYRWCGDIDDQPEVRVEEQIPVQERIDQACFNGNFDAVKRIFDNALHHPNLHFKRPPIIAAVENPDVDNLAIVRFLLKRGQTVTPLRIETLVYCPLQMAVKNGKVDIVKILVDNGAKAIDPNYNTNAFRVLDESDLKPGLKDVIRAHLQRAS